MSEVPPEMKERIERAKGFLSSMHAKPTEEIVGAFETTRKEFMAELDGLTPSQIEFKPAPERWSIREVCLHVSQAMRGVGGLMAVLGSGGTPPAGVKAQPGTLDADPGDFAAIRTMVEQGFEMAMQSARSLDTMTTPDKQFLHPWFGELDMRGWAVFNILHGNVHVNQIRKNKSAQGYPAT